MNFLDNPYLFGGLFGGVPILLIAIFAWYGRRQRYSQLESSRGFPLRFCSETRFKSWWKFFPWEGVGFLRVESQRLIFEGHPNCGEAFAIEAPIGQLQFHGRRNWFRNGFLPWLRLPSDPGDYFLCVETGPLIFGAGGKTKKLLAALKQQAEQGGAGEPATRAESDSEGDDKPQPESEGRSR